MTGIALAAMGAIAASREQAVVTVTGIVTIIDIQAADAEAGVRFQTNGNVQQVLSTGITQLAPTTDWIRPAGSASSAFEIRATVTAGSNPDAGDLINTWLSLGTERDWLYQQATSGSSSGTLLIEIRKSGGPVLDSGSYPCNATVI